MPTNPPAPYQYLRGFAWAAVFLIALKNVKMHFSKIFDVSLAANLRRNLPPCPHTNLLTLPATPNTNPKQYHTSGRNNLKFILRSLLPFLSSFTYGKFVGSELAPKATDAAFPTCAYAVAALAIMLGLNKGRQAA